ncbi:MAG: MATE family efflux transporter [Faecalibacterium sp.]
MQDPTSSLLHGPVRPALLRYALPTILSMLATQFYTVADTMIIGLQLDANALASVSNASTMLMIFLFISGGLELGGGLLAAAKKPTASKQELSRLIHNLLFVDFEVALLIAVLGWFGSRRLLLWINTPAAIVEEAVLYSRIFLLGLPALMLYDLSKQIVVGCGDSRTPLRAVVATSVLNILLDLALVRPFGVAGAAAATSIAQFAGAAFMMRHLHSTMLEGSFQLSMMNPSVVKDIFRLSVPSTVQQGSGALMSVFKQSLLGGLGVAAIAGFSCANKLSSLLMMPVYGFVQSVVFFIAQNTTAQQPDRVQEGLREGRRILLIYSLLVVGICVGFNSPLLRLFTTDPGAAAFGRTMLACESAAYLFTAQKHLLEARLRGAQKMGLYLVSNLGQIALNISCCAVLVPRVGFNGFWISSYISAPAGLVLAFVMVRLSGCGKPEQTAAQ